MSSLGYTDPDGARHEIVVRRTATGDWQVLDTSADETRVIETLAGREDGEPQAEGVARDYLTVGRFTAAGREAGKRIPEQGGADAHSDRRPHREAPQPHARGAALSRQAG